MINVLRLKKYSRIAISKVNNHFQTWLYLKTKRYIPKPLKVYYMISNKCNYSCPMCPQWVIGKSENKAEYIDVDKIKRVIDEMHSLKIQEFGISGGEPLIYFKEVFDLLKYANSKKIYTHFVTNGKLLTEEILFKYNKIGGGHISLSIDGLGKKHDIVRGYAGAYSEIERVMGIYSKKKYPNIVLKINTVISNQNLDEIIPIAKLAIEKETIIFIQPFDPYSYGDRDTLLKEKKFSYWVSQANYSKLKEVVSSLLKLKKENPQIILNDFKHLSSFEDYFSDPNFSTKCYVMLDQITIDPFGKISLCKYGEFGDLNKQSLAEFLNSEKRKKVVEDSLECTEGCLLGCMYKPSLKDLAVNGSKQFLKLIN